MACALLIAGTAAADDDATFTLLEGSIIALDVSDDGSRVVTYGAHALWIDGVPIQFNDNEAPNAISGDGSTVIGTLTVGGLMYAGRWQEATGWQNLGDLGKGGCDAFRSNGYNCNQDGSVVVGLGWDGCKGRAFVWTEDTGMFALPQTTTDSARANAVSDDAMTIVGWQQETCREEAVWFAWDQTETLFELGNCGEFFDVSDDGAVLVGENNGQAVRWTKDEGLVPLGGSGRAFGCNADGSVIVGETSFGAFIWTPEDGMQNLRDVLIANGAIGVGTLSAAIEVNADGTTIVGSEGFFPFNTAFVATLPGSGCFADFDDDGNLTILDFVAYQNAFTSGDASADCDDNGQLNILDFVCFQNEFQAGCN
jgi:uncharacterized membrane protein